MQTLIDTLFTLATKGTTPQTEEFRKAVLQAVSDGKLTKDEIDMLEKKREEMGLPLSVLDAIRVQAYMSAFEMVKGDTTITDDEWDELEQIQDYLGLKDSDIAKTKRELYRLRVLSEIREGNLPIVHSPHIILKNGEIAHWNEVVTLLMPREQKKDSGPSITVRFSKGQSFHLGIQKAHDEKGLVVTDAGELTLTNKRIVFRGKKESIAINLSQIVDVECFTSAVRLHINRRHALLFAYKDPRNADIVGSVLFQLLSIIAE